MDWMEITAVMGNLGEFAASIGVLATLIYLAIQIRHNTDALRSNARIESLRVWQSFNDLALQSPDLIALGSRTYDSEVSFSDFEGPEQARVGLFVRSQLQRFTEQFVRYESGYLPADEWAQTRSVLAGFIRDLPVWREHWQRDRAVLMKAFVKDVEAAEPIRFDNYNGRPIE